MINNTFQINHNNTSMVSHDAPSLGMWSWMVRWKLWYWFSGLEEVLGTFCSGIRLEFVLKPIPSNGSSPSTSLSEILFSAGFSVFQHFYQVNSSLLSCLFRLSGANIIISVQSHQTASKYWYPNPKHSLTARYSLLSNIILLGPSFWSESWDGPRSPPSTGLLPI